MSLVGQRLREAMVLRGVDQEELAEKIGATQGAISKILVGKTRNSRLMPRIATVLQFPLPWLLGHTDEREPTDESTAGITYAERQLLDMMRGLPSHDLNLVTELVRSLSKGARRQTLHEKRQAYRGE